MEAKQLEPTSIGRVGPGSLNPPPLAEMDVKALMGSRLLQPQPRKKNVDFFFVLSFKKTKLSLLVHEVRIYSKGRPRWRDR